MEPQSRFIEVDGVKFHVADWGGQGPDLFLLHAGGFLGRIYRAMITPLLAEYHVLTMDLRGQGDSDKPAPEYFHWRYFTHDVEGVIEQLGLRDFYGVGHSGGGAMIAYYTATHPGRVKRLVLLEPIIVPHEPEFLAHMGKDDGEFVERARRRRIVWDTRQQLFDAYRAKGAFSTWREDVLWDYVNHGTYNLPDGRIALKCPAELEAQLFANSTSLDIFSHMSRIDCPALVLRGEYTDLPIAVIAERVAQRIPCGSLMTIPDTSHFLAMEKPEDIARIIAEYFRAEKGR
jgi:pimeloyl-ACP methyl ester carboxylesterase